MQSLVSGQNRGHPDRRGPRINGDHRVFPNELGRTCRDGALCVCHSKITISVVAPQHVLGRKGPDTAMEAAKLTESDQTRYIPPDGHLGDAEQGASSLIVQKL